jgi:hypothetical protein
MASAGGDPREYTRQYEGKLRAAELAAVQDYIAEAGALTELHAQASAAAAAEMGAAQQTWAAASYRLGAAWLVWGDASCWLGAIRCEWNCRLVFSMH